MKRERAAEENGRKKCFIEEKGPLFKFPGVLGNRDWRFYLRETQIKLS